METAKAIAARLQPISRSRERSSTPGAERIPDATSRVQKVTPTTTQA